MIVPPSHWRFEQAFCNALVQGIVGKDRRCCAGPLRLGFQKGPRQPLLRGEVESLRPPRSGEVICCLAWILGESHDSGLRLGLDARADHGVSSGASRTVRGKSRDPLPFSRSGLKMGDFRSRQISGHEGRGTGKSATPGGHIIVSRKK